MRYVGGRQAWWGGGGKRIEYFFLFVFLFVSFLGGGGGKSIKNKFGAFFPPESLAFTGLRVCVGVKSKLAKMKSDNLS